MFFETYRDKLATRIRMWSWRLVPGTGPAAGREWCASSPAGGIPSQPASSAFLAGRWHSGRPERSGVPLRRPVAFLAAGTEWCAASPAGGIPSRPLSTAGALALLQFFDHHDRVFAFVDVVVGADADGAVVEGAVEL